MGVVFIVIIYFYISIKLELVFLSCECSFVFFFLVVFLVVCFEFGDGFSSLVGGFYEMGDWDDGWGDFGFILGLLCLVLEFEVEGLVVKRMWFDIWVL